MAYISSGVACSHVPALGVASDKGITGDDYYGPIFKGFEYSRAWMEAEKPDLVFLVYNDHCTAFDVPMTMMFGQPDAWPCPVVPLAVNVVQYPAPLGSRCYALGKAIRKAIESYPEDLKVCVFGTGGMSHQLQHQRAGLINSEWDARFMDLLVNDPDQGCQIEHIEYLREAGSEGIELVMWYVMRGALNENVEEKHRFYHVPASNTAVGHLILENR